MGPKAADEALPRVIIGENAEDAAATISEPIPVKADGLEAREAALICCIIAAAHGIVAQRARCMRGGNPSGNLVILQKAHNHYCDGGIVIGRRRNRKVVYLEMRNCLVRGEMKRNPLMAKKHINGAEMNSN